MFKMLLRRFYDHMNGLWIFTIVYQGSRDQVYSLMTKLPTVFCLSIGRIIKLLVCVRNIRQIV